MSPQSASAPAAAVDVPVVGPREPCPCGSGKRYKVCHGRGARAAASAFVPRPFAGLASEADWVALREIVPAASTTVVTSPGSAEHGVEPGTRVSVVTVLPGAVPGLRRPDGQVVVGLQMSSGDASRDAAAALLRAAALEPGRALEPTGLPGPGPRLQDLLTDDPLVVTVHEGFGFWAAEDPEELDPAARSALDEASAAVDPTARVAGLGDVLDGGSAAYWTTASGRELLRWVLPQDEDALLDALGRLSAQRAGSAAGLAVADGARYLGAFRAQGLLAGVWELAAGTGPDGLERALPAFAERLAAALAADGPLSADERRARAGVVSRQLTLR